MLHCSLIFKKFSYNAGTSDNEFDMLHDALLFFLFSVVTKRVVLQGEIRVTGFNQEVDKFFTLVEVGKVRRSSR